MKDPMSTWRTGVMRRAMTMVVLIAGCAAIALAGCGSAGTTSVAQVETIDSNTPIDGQFNDGSTVSSSVTIAPATTAPATAPATQTGRTGTSTQTVPDPTTVNPTTTIDAPPADSSSTGIALVGSDVQRIGAFDLTKGGTLGAAIAAFGEPTGSTQVAHGSVSTCTAVWEPIGLRGDFEASGADQHDCGAATVRKFDMSGSAWHLVQPLLLRVGAQENVIKQSLPMARPANSGATTIWTIEGSSTVLEITTTSGKVSSFAISTR